MIESPPIEYVRPHVYAKQREFIDSDARYTIVEASTKTGKTVGCLVWLFEQALQGQESWNYWWVAPTYTIAGIAFRRLKRWLASSGFPKELWEGREGDQAVIVAGRVIWFKGADKPDSLYGEDVYGAVIDEATRCKEDAWHAVRSTLTATRGPVKIIGNVRGRKNWAYQLARRAESGQKDLAYFKLTAWDAVDGGVLDADEVEDAQRILPEPIFKQLYLAEPADDGGNPFGLAAIAACVKPLSSKPAVVYGVDVAKSVDWTVAVGLDEDCNTCVLERWQTDWGQTRRRLAGIIKNTPALIDSTGVGDPIVEDLQRECGNVVGYKFSSASKQKLMEGLAAAFQQKEIGIPDGWLRSECENFEYVYSANGVRYSAPEGLHDDGVCGLSLARRHFTTVKSHVVNMSMCEPSIVY